MNLWNDTGDHSFLIDQKRHSDLSVKKTPETVPVFFYLLVGDVEY